MTGYVFVGERRSARAIAMGVTWTDGRLAARTLFDALRAGGIDPRAQVYLNAFADDGRRDEEALASLDRHRQQGRVIVALGRRAQRAVAGMGVPHLRLIHPAARGAIRRTAAYHAHVAAVLGGRTG
jgi:hypothetical protein